MLCSGIITDALPGKKLCYHLSCPEGNNSVIRRILLAQHIISEPIVYLLSQFTWEQSIQWEKSAHLYSLRSVAMKIFSTQTENDKLVQIAQVRVSNQIGVIIDRNDYGDVSSLEYDIWYANRTNYVLEVCCTSFDLWSACASIVEYNNGIMTLCETLLAVCVKAALDIAVTWIDINSAPRRQGGYSTSGGTCSVGRCGVTLTPTIE